MRNFLFFLVYMAPLSQNVYTFYLRFTALLAFSLRESFASAGNYYHALASCTLEEGV